MVDPTPLRLLAARSRSARMLPRLLAAVLMTIGLVIAGAGPLYAADGQPTVTMLKVDGTITPVMATYIGRGIDRAVDRGDSAVILRMDTPGGLSSAMDDIIKDILASPIPVIVYVAPDGARAASAGMYITYAAHVAAMAPTTNIGSATPINLGGQEDTTLTPSEKKVINDAVAKVRALAELRGRNADWAEQAVREAENVTASAAVNLGVVDFIASDVNDLLAQSNGRVVKVPGGTATVNTANARVRTVDMSFFEKLLQVVSDPNIAFILISTGTLALVFELANPGLIVPGVAGGLMMLLGFYSLGTLDTNWAGLSLVLFALLLFVAEVFVPSHGALTIGGIASFIFGGLLLANSQNDQVLNLSKVLVFTVAIALGLFFFLIVGAAARTRKLPPSSGAQAMIGAVGVARTDLDPSGMVFLNGELWGASSVGGSIAKGEQVVVMAMHGIRLEVAPRTAASGTTPPGTAPHPA